MTNAEAEQVFQILLEGLTRAEQSLPPSCTPETEQAIGEAIRQAKGVAKQAESTFKALAQPKQDEIGRLRSLWYPLRDRAMALASKAQSLVEALLAERVKARMEEERAARERVAAAQKAQAEAEARALAAETEAAAKLATAEADAAWNITREAVAKLDAAPVQTSVKVGDVSVYEASRLDFEITDMGAFAKAHPTLVDIKRGETLKGLRAALAGHVSLPETLPGWPGLKLKMSKKVSSR